MYRELLEDLSERHEFIEFSVSEGIYGYSPTQTLVVGKLLIFQVVTQLNGNYTYEKPVDYVKDRVIHPDDNKNEAIESICRELLLQVFAKARLSSYLIEKYVKPQWGKNE